MTRHAQGILLITLSAVAFSSAGLFTRIVTLDIWTTVFWRGLFAGLMVFAVVLLQERRGPVAALCTIGLPGIAVAVSSTAATILFLHAFRLTSVADAVVIFAATPFLAAALGWWWLGVKVAWATLVASLVALLGVAIMMGGTPTAGHLAGNLLAFGTALCTAIMLLIIRREQHVSLLPAAGLSALLCPLLVWPFATPLAVDGANLVYLFLFGTLQFGLGLVLLTIGGRWVSATENALLNTLETPLAIVWVWLCIGEAPTAAAFIGGTIVMAAVVAHVLATVGDRARADGG